MAMCVVSRNYQPLGALMQLSDPLSCPFIASLLGLQQPAAHHQDSYARDVVAVANTPVDWKESPDAHIFIANLPGVAKEDVKVEVEDGRVLQITGEGKKEEPSPNEHWHCAERPHGHFLRRFRLPDNANVDEVKATMKNGVLTVIVPKVVPPEAKANVKSIEIFG